MRGPSHMATERRKRIGRRSFLVSAGSLAATPLLGGIDVNGFAQTSASRSVSATESGLCRGARSVCNS